MSELPVASAAQARERLLRLLSVRRRSVAAVLGLSAGSTAASLAGPALIGVVVDAALGDGSGVTTVDRAAVAFVVLTILGAALQRVAAARAAVVGESALAELRREVFDHALAIPVEQLEAAGSGDLVSRVTGDVNVLSNAVRWSLPVVVFAVVEALLTCVALVLVDWRLGVAALVAGAPAAVVGARWYLRESPERYRAERRAHATLAGELLSAYRGSGTLIAYGAIGPCRERLLGAGRRLVDAQMWTTAARNRLRPAVSAALALALLVVLGLGSFLVSNNLVTAGAVAAAALYAIRLFEPIGVLLEQVDEVQQATAAAARLVGVTLLEAPVPSPATAGRSQGEPVGGGGLGCAIELRSVDAGYLDGPPVLRDLSLEIQRGTRVVVVGASGAGKSTLVKVMLGWLSPRNGTVLVNGRPVLEMPPKQRAATIALVAQEAHVFARTVADNVRLARATATDDEVRSALRAVGALDAVMALPHGIETVIDSLHEPLSAAEVQQLALARLVCADPSIVLLDEATADLDPIAAGQTERHLLAALHGRTVVTVAHRLSHAISADRVLMIESGVIVEDGTHHELLEAGGGYAALWARWIAERGDTR